MFASLQKRSWAVSKEPLIGLAQAFGGLGAHIDDYWVTPPAKDIETQSQSFCEYGASWLSFYAWDDSGFGPTVQTPMNNREIETGIRNGVAACKQIWSQHSREQRQGQPGAVFGVYTRLMKVYTASSSPSLQLPIL
jgi:hypothetical protein